ncbi:hypothetical protein Taro_037617 [Colocasia esculenta]|uniref:Strictosidine synthase conserved region domain-containing protein n=1 Tax=Colocasia esculenta TaxID=4460 RepID=A0A843W122_COLES|nr:hypothetical protein [Colocasia esculenta]
MAAHGVTFRFTNGIYIDQETSTVYFTDSSTRFQRREFILATIAGDKMGRLMRYDPATGELRVLLDELSFPNGVALSRDGRGGDHPLQGSLVLAAHAQGRHSGGVHGLAGLPRWGRS